MLLKMMYIVTYTILVFQSQLYLQILFILRHHMLFWDHSLTCRGAVHISPFPIVVQIYSTSIEWLRETSFAFRQWYFQVAKLWSICMAMGGNLSYFH